MAAIPDHVKDRIRAKAQSDWPTDFEMQRHIIDEQVEAYLELKALKKDFASDEVFGAIFSFASASWRRLRNGASHLQTTTRGSRGFLKLQSF